MEQTEIYVGSGNVFADMDLPHPEERLAKAEVAIRIQELIAECHLTQAEAATLMNTSEAELTGITRGHLRLFTLDRLFQCLTALGQDVEITIRPKAAEEEFARVLVAHSYLPASAACGRCLLPPNSLSQKRRKYGTADRRRRGPSAYKAYRPQAVRELRIHFRPF
jgi:predicted XRE-type DNA-binding protein